MADQELPEEHQQRGSEEVHGRLAMPLLIPAVVFLFAVLVIYGLSRIYLELNDYSIGDVTMATPLAIGVALVIMLIAAYLAAQRTISVFQIGGVFIVGATLLTAGSVWAAVHEESQDEHVVAPPENGTPSSPGAITIGLSEYEVSVGAETAAAGDVTFAITNEGTILHNFRVAQTDTAPGGLPLSDDGIEVDEEAANVVASGDELGAGSGEEVAAQLEAGAYVLFCNIPGHYDLGMYTGFTVE